MNERVKFILAHQENDETFTELCECFGISRKQGYKWLARFEEGGLHALTDRSRRDGSGKSAPIRSGKSAPSRKGQKG